MDRKFQNLNTENKLGTAQNSPLKIAIDRSYASTDAATLT